MALDYVYEDYQPKGYEKLTLSGTPQGLTVPSGAEFALIIAEGGVARWRDDGQAPSATDSMPLPELDPFWYSGVLSALQFITTGVTLHVSYYAPIYRSR